MLKDGISVKVSIQWLVKNNIVVQQIVITNTGSSSIDYFPIRTSQHMLIRDLDYRRSPACDFNNDENKNYVRGRGPNEFSWITANTFDTEKPVASRGNEGSGEHAASTSGSDHQAHQAQSPRGSEGIRENKETTNLPEPSSGEYSEPQKASGQDHVGSDLLPVECQRTGVTDSSIDLHQHETEECEAAEKTQAQLRKEKKSPPSDDEVWQERRISDTWSAKDAHSVVSVMCLYVNGTAQKMEMKPRPMNKIIGPYRSSTSVLEIAVAYKMIVVPKGRVHWKNFLIPAEMADVSTMLEVETEQLWGHSITDDCKCGHSLCDLGLSMVDLEMWNVSQNTSGDGQASQDSGITNHGAKRSMEVHGDTTTIANSQMDVKKEEISTEAESSYKHGAAQDTTATTSAGGAMRTSPKPSPINNIEYLVWRHTEHILSVCSIPLSVPLLSHADGVSEPTSIERNLLRSSPDVLDTSEGQEIDPEIPLALTCGDTSGHRICTSASL